MLALQEGTCLENQFHPGSVGPERDGESVPEPSRNRRLRLAAHLLCLLGGQETRRSCPRAKPARPCLCPFTPPRPQEGQGAGSSLQSAEGGGTRGPAPPSLPAAHALGRNALHWPVPSACVQGLRMERPSHTRRGVSLGVTAFKAAPKPQTTRVAGGTPGSPQEQVRTAWALRCCTREATRGRHRPGVSSREEGAQSPPRFPLPGFPLIKVGSTWLRMCPHSLATPPHCPRPRRRLSWKWGWPPLLRAGGCLAPVFPPLPCRAGLLPGHWSVLASYVMLSPCPGGREAQTSSYGARGQGDEEPGV